MENEVESLRDCLFQGWLVGFFRARDEFVLHDDSGAGIPAEQCIIVAGRSQGFSAFVPTHGFNQLFMRIKARTATALVKKCLGTTLANDACVISSLVLI